MPFDATAFDRAEFKRREKAVAVPELKQWYGDGEPLWTVQSLTADEMARVKAAPKTNEAMADLVETLAAATGKDRQSALRRVLDIDDKGAPEEHIRRLHLLVHGSADPSCDLSLAKKIAKVAPIVFQRLTDEVLTMTGLGFEPGKPKGSGESHASATP